MKVLKALRAKPALFFRLSGIRLTDFNELPQHRITRRITDVEAPSKGLGVTFCDRR